MIIIFEAVSPPYHGPFVLGELRGKLWTKLMMQESSPALTIGPRCIARGNLAEALPVIVVRLNRDQSTNSIFLIKKFPSFKSHDVS